MSLIKQFQKYQVSFLNWIEQKYFRQRGIMNFLLLPFSIFYLLGFFCKFYLVSPKKINARVICVGNLVVGGSGKTPFAIALAKELIRKKHKVAFISRGYGGSLSSNLPLRVIQTKHLSTEVGDEPLILAQTAPTYICTNRYLAAQKAIKGGAKVIIMDDGLQNNSLFKDVNIMVVNGEYKFGNRLPIPAGPLRELPSFAAPRIDLVASYYHEIKFGTVDCFKIDTISTTDFKGEACIALAGIANPDRFLKAIKDNGITIKKKFIFPDHHQYTSLELAEITQTAKKLKLTIITTSKDFARLPKEIDKTCFMVLEIRAIIPKGFIENIESKLV